MSPAIATVEEVKTTFLTPAFFAAFNALSVPSTAGLIISFSSFGSAITNGNDEILLASSAGKLIRFSEKKVRPMGRTARGVRGMRIKKDQQIISLMVANNEKEILCVSENGFGKKTSVDDFPTHNRGGQGVISIKTSERNGLMVASTLVDNNDGIMLISDKGTMIRTSAEQIPTISRNTQGVKIITPKEGEKILECVRIDPEDEEE